MSSPRSGALAAELRTDAGTQDADKLHAWILPVLLIGQAMAAMDTSIANVAAPAIRNDLGISGAVLQMAVAGYVLAYAVFLITGARLGDDYGYRRLFMIGVGVFTVASLGCGLAPHTAVLVVSRVVQGIGAAAMVPQVLSLIQRHYTGAARARAVGYYSMILGLGSAVGQLLGGVLVTFAPGGLSWRPAFLINVPVGIVILLLSRRALPATRGEQRRKLDLIGVLSLSLSMLCFVVPLTFGAQNQWPLWTRYCLAASIVGMVLLVVYERALAKRGGSPLLNFDAMRAKGIPPGLAVVAIGFTGYGGWLFATALYLQTGRGLSPFLSGATFMAYALGFGIANVKWSKLPPHLLRWTPTAALATMAVSNLLFGLVVARTGWWPIVTVPLLFVAGGSHGLSFGTTVNQMSERTRTEHMPALSGLVTTSTQLSIVIGIASLGALYLAASAAGIAAAPHAMSYVTFTIAAGALIGIACSLRLAMVRTLAASPSAAVSAAVSVSKGSSK